MTFERHQDVSQTDHLSTKTHRPQTIHPVCAAFQVIDLIAICSTHGLIFPVTLSNFSAMGLSSIVQTVQNQAPRHKYEDRRLEITWFARRITIYKPFFLNIKKVLITNSSINGVSFKQTMFDYQRVLLPFENWDTSRGKSRPPLGGASSVEDWVFGGSLGWFL